jgi:hypothetical protein
MEYAFAAFVISCYVLLIVTGHEGSTQELAAWIGALVAFLITHAGSQMVASETSKKISNDVADTAAEVAAQVAADRANGGNG